MKTTKGEYALARVLAKANRIMCEHREHVSEQIRHELGYRAELGRIIAWIVVLIALGTPHQNFAV